MRDALEAPSSTMRSTSPGCAAVTQLLVFLLAACGAPSATSSAPAAQGGGFSLSVSPSSLTLPPGATATATVTVARSAGAADAIEIALEGLPDGVAVDPLVIPAGSSRGTLLFHNGRIGSPVLDLAIRVRGSSGSDTAGATFSLTVQCPGNAQQLSVLVGAPGGPGYADDAGQNARFNVPTGVVGDGAGHLYVADTFNHAIRKIDVASGAVTTLAGSPGNPGASDGTADAARFAFPFALTIAGSSLFVADTLNSTIRRIDLASGAVTTFAGVAGEFGASDGPAGAARFDTPFGITAASGSLFVADTGNDTIRKIDVASGFVTTLAGSPGEAGSEDGTCDLARFDWPSGVAADGSGNLFVADSANHTIRKIVIATEAVTTLAGAAGQAGTAGGIGAAARFNSPTALAFDGADTLFVADTVNQLIRSISISSRNVVSVWGATSSVCNQPDDPGRLCFPRGVAVDRGTLYVANSNVDDIRAADVIAGDIAAIRVIAGLPLHRGSDGPRFDDPIFIAADGAGSLYVADSRSGEIRRVSLSRDGSIRARDITTVAGSPSPNLLLCQDGVGGDAGFAQPSGVAVDADSLFVTDTGSSTIRQIAVATGEVTTIAGTCFAAGFANAVGPDARFSVPTGIVADGRGLLYVADSSAIRAVFEDTHLVSTLAGSFQQGSADGIGGAAGFRFPNGLAIDADGSFLYVADTGNHTIRRISLTTAAVTTLAGVPGMAGTVDGVGAEARFNAPFGLAFDGVGGLLVSESNTIRRLDLATFAVSTVLGEPGAFHGVKLGSLPARLNQPGGLALIAPGQLAVVDRAENVLLMFQ